MEKGQGYSDHTTQYNEVKDALGYECVPTSCCLDPEKCQGVMPSRYSTLIIFNALVWRMGVKDLKIQDLVDPIRGLVWEVHR